MPRGTKREAGDMEEDPNGEGSVTITTEGANSNARSTRNKSRRISRLEEYDEDPGREESRNFQKWALMFDSNIKSQAENSKVLLKDFRGRIAQEVDQLRKYQEQEMSQLIQVRDMFLSNIKNTCAIALEAPANLSGNHKGKQISGKETHVLFQDAQSVLSQSSTMLQELKKIDKRLENYKLEPPVARWKQDKRQMKDLLANGRQEAEEIVERLLIPNNYPTPKTDKHGPTDTQELKLFEESNKALKGDNWGFTAAEQAKHLMAMVKRLLPEERANMDNK